MSLCFTRFWLLAAFSIVAAISSSAQQTIINSKPKDVDLDKANSFMESPGRLNAGDYKAPRQFLEPIPSLPPPAYLNTWDSSASDAANKRKNWTLLTPRQILGVQTPDEILGLDSSDDRKKLSLEEQFLLRQRQPWPGAATNGGAGALFLRDDVNPFSNNNQNNRNDRATPPPFSLDSRQPDLNQSDSFRSLKKLIGNMDAGSVSHGDDQRQNQNSIWTSGFAQPPRPKVNQGQLDNMERFRALLEPRSPVENTVAAPTRFTPTKPGSSSSSFFDPPPNVNPAGRTYSSVESDIRRPKGLAPLPGVTGPVIKPDENKRPAWKAKLPPWMSSGPQPYNP